MGEKVKYPIRVLCVFSTLDRGGAESMCMNIYRHIDRSKVQFDFVKHTENTGAFEEEIEALGGKIYTAPRFGLDVIKYRSWWKKHLEKHPEHLVIHGHYFTASAVYFEIARRLGRVTVGHSHIAKFNNKKKALICRNVEKHCDYCFACGREAGKLLYHKKHFMVINNAIDSEKFRFSQSVRNEYREALGLDDKVVIGIVANFSEHKNPFGVINIFRELIKINNNCCLLWVGGGSVLKEQVKFKINEYGLQDKVILLGVREDISELMQAMDAFILPSFYEGLPVVLIEAQATGLPCYVSDTVTDEVDITGLCKFMPIEKEKEWVTLLDEKRSDRGDTCELIKKAGYDIYENAKWLQDFYCKIITGV